MKLTPITTKQFVWSTVFITIGFGFLMLTNGRGSFLFTGPLLAAMFMTMPAADRNRPLTRNQLLAALGAMIATAALIWWCVTHRNPNRDSWGSSFVELYSRPALAIPFWLLFVILGFRRWRMRLVPQDSIPPDPHQITPD
jgi:hypothetical protein